MDVPGTRDGKTTVVERIMANALFAANAETAAAGLEARQVCRCSAIASLGNVSVEGRVVAAPSSKCGVEATTVTALYGVKTVSPREFKNYR